MSELDYEIGDLVLDALEKSIQHEGEYRLKPSGKQQGLLPGGNATAAKKLALDQCCDAKLGLFAIREVVEGKGKSPAKVQYATITRHGIETLFQRKTADERRELLDGCASSHKEIAHEALLHVAAGELKQVESQRQTLDSRATELRKFVQGFVSEQLAALDLAMKNLDRQRDEIQQLVSGAPEPEKKQVASPGPRGPLPRPTPATEGDIEFQQHLCRELVFAWQDAAGDPEVQASLEPVMMNAGLERIGEVDELVLCHS